MSDLLLHAEYQVSVTSSYLKMLAGNLKAKCSFATQKEKWVGYFLIADIMKWRWVWLYQWNVWEKGRTASSTSKYLSWVCKENSQTYSNCKKMKKAKASLKQIHWRDKEEPRERGPLLFYCLQQFPFANICFPSTLYCCSLGVDVKNHRMVWVGWSLKII